VYTLSVIIASTIGGSVSTDSAIAGSAWEVVNQQPGRMCGQSQAFEVMSSLASKVNR
jgi:hypothetical protein